MPVFTYNASDQAAEIISGTIAAGTPRQARDLLRERGLVIRDIKTYAPTTKSKSRWLSRSHRHHTTQFIRELSTHKPIMYSEAMPVASTAPPVGQLGAGGPADHTGNSNHLDNDRLSLLEIGRRAALHAEREVIERVLLETRWNRRQAAKILKISYKALLNKLRLIEEQSTQSK